MPMIVPYTIQIHSWQVGLRDILPMTTRAEPLFASRGFFEDVLFPSWLEFFRTDGGYAWSGYGSCKSKTNVTIPCPASLYGATDVLYSVFAVGLLDEMPKKQKEKLERHFCRCGTAGIPQLSFPPPTTA